MLVGYGCSLFVVYFCLMFVDKVFFVARCVCVVSGVCCRGCLLSFVVVVDIYCCLMSMLLRVVAVRCFFAV